MTIPEHLSDVELQVLHHRASQEIDRRGGHMDSYAAPHVWNLVAKILRENYPTTDHTRTPSGKARLQGTRRTIERFALAFASRFAEDEGFDAVAWLDKCSPDPELYPFSELWEEIDVDG